MKGKTHTPDDRLDTSEAAGYLGKSTSWLNKERSHGRGPRFVKIGAAVRYVVRDLDAYLESRVRETADSRSVA